jgi:hypothetical protein
MQIRELYLEVDVLRTIVDSLEFNARAHHGNYAEEVRFHGIAKQINLLIDAYDESTEEDKKNAEDRAFKRRITLAFD